MPSIMLHRPGPVLLVFLRQAPWNSCGLLFPGNKMINSVSKHQVSARMTAGVAGPFQGAGMMGAAPFTRPNTK